MSDESLRVLMLNHNRRGVGTFYRCWHLAKELGRLGHEVVLVTVSARRRLIPETQLDGGLTIIETPNLLDLVYGLGSGYGLVGIPHRMVVAARDRADVVHTFDHKPNVLLPALLSRAFSGCPLVADWADWWGRTEDGSGLQEWRGWPVADLEHALEEFIHRRADWVTAISTGLRDRALAMGVSPDRVRWIPSGAPAEDIRPQDMADCRHALGISPSTYLVGYVGSAVRDLDMMAEVVPAIRRRHPEVKLAVIGPGPQLDFSTSGLREAVVNFGHVPFSQLSLYLGACDAFALPMADNVFNRTRWPNKFGDYLAAGRPVVCSDVGDVADIVKTEGCGYVWRDASELISAIDSLVDDRATSLQMGECARHVADNRLSWRKLALAFLSVYSRAVAQT